MSKELCFKLLKQFRQAAHKDAIIDMNNKNKYVLLMPCVKESWVCLTCVETEISKSTQECNIPFSPGLLKPIERFFQPPDRVLPLTFISGWCLHIDFFIFI